MFREFLDACTAPTSTTILLQVPSKSKHIQFASCRFKSNFANRFLTSHLSIYIIARRTASTIDTFMMISRIINLSLCVATLTNCISTAAVNVPGQEATVTVRKQTTTTAGLFCRIHHSDVLMIPEEKKDDYQNHMKSMGITDCIPTTSASNGNVVHEVIVVNDEDDNDEDATVSLIGKYGHGLLYQYLQYELDWIVDTHDDQNISDYHDGAVTMNTKIMMIPDDIPIESRLYDHSHPTIQRHLQQISETSSDRSAMIQHRKMERIVTDETRDKMLVVRVATQDENVTTSIEEIEEYVFGTQEDSFVNVHTGCTLGQKNIVPYNVDIPVLDTVLAGDSSGYTFGSFFTAAEPIIIDLLNLTGMIVSLHDVVEYVLLVGPKGLRPTTQQPNFRFVAAGAYDSYKVVVTDDWIDTPQVIQHEVGHNYNFGHPWEKDVIYGDTTSVMGQVYRNTKFNCYNGVHYHHAGWMNSTTLALDFSEDATTMTSMTTDLAFYGHMDRIADDTPTLIVSNGFYIMYNRATGINAETNEYPDGVLLHRYKEMDVVQSGTDLVAALELSGDNRFFSSTDFDLAIELCSQNDSGNDNEPDTVTVVIGAIGSVACPDTASDVPSSSPVPTVSPAPTVSPVPSEMPSDSPTTSPTTVRRRRRLHGIRIV